MIITRSTIITGLAVLVLVAAIPSAIRDIVAIGIILDAVAQLLIFRQIHPGAALVVGPVLIAMPYALARALSNRWARRQAGATAGSPPAEA